jgi:hypothetical protein
MENFSFDIEVFEDEIVAIRIEDGTYYMFKQGNAFLTFNYLNQGGSIEKLKLSLDGNPTFSTSLNQFLQFLKEEGFQFKDDSKLEIELPQFTNPEFNFKKFDDMGDLIKLDPIHDVSDLGWPEKK